MPIFRKTMLSKHKRAPAAIEVANKAAFIGTHLKTYWFKRTNVRSATPNSPKIDDISLKIPLIKNIINSYPIILLFLLYYCKDNIEQQDDTNNDAISDELPLWYF